MERFEDIWISSEEHLDKFKEVKKNRKILKNMHELDVSDRLYDFPRVMVGNNIFPVIFENIGRLILSDDNLQFYNCGTEDKPQYDGINKSGNFHISIENIINIELATYKKALISYFDNTWVKIHFIEDGINKNILISNSGVGFMMKKVKNKNMDLLKLIKEKMN
ncbi:hypothetical protein [Fulvivirga ligni]|uniref:hypothetical protein n=1 Tax=Fulvivirga ligni TaxID=2904246 RepID=UPI001F17F027|nr:hypothetical protein [Fulvivirga ligni]UII19106.1 hypothetical protein LVD16_14775 [Fulvivirga ligni]